MSSRPLPARMLPIPSTVSVEVAAAMAEPLDAKVAILRRAPGPGEDWTAYVAELEAGEAEMLAAIRARCSVTIEQGTLAGVPVFTVTPADPDPARRHWRLMHLHGGAYVLGGGWVGLREAVLVAHYVRATVVAVDYRLAPRHPFPAAVDDALAVWTALVAVHNPRAMAVFGTSTGGALTVALALAARAANVPLAAALVASTPWSDLTDAGDSYETNRDIDSAAPFYEGLLERSARAYAGPHDLAHPLASPIHADLTGLPPTMLLTGTRDLFLSNTVRLHRALRAAGVTAELHVFEGISHGQLNALPFSPEGQESLAETNAWLGRWLV